MASETLDWQTPLFVLTVVTTNISAILNFQFWEPVYFATTDSLSITESLGFHQKLVKHADVS